MTDSETYSIYLKMIAQVDVKVPKSLPKKENVAELVALDRIETVLHSKPVSEDIFQSWCDIIGTKNYEECKKKYGNIWDSIKAEYSDGSWEVEWIEKR